MCGRGAGSTGCCANCSISRRVMFGASKASPAATHPHRAEQVVGQRVLQQEPARTGAQRIEHVLVEVEGREDEDARATVARRDDARVASIPSISGMRMSIRMTSGRSRGHQSTASRRCAASPDDLDVVGRPQQHREPAPHEGLVVGDRDADHSASPYGNSATTAKPPPARAGVSVPAVDRRPARASRPGRDRRRGTAVHTAPVVGDLEPQRHPARTRRARSRAPDRRA